MPREPSVKHGQNGAGENGRDDGIQESCVLETVLRQVKMDAKSQQRIKMDSIPTVPHPPHMQPICI